MTTATDTPPATESLKATTDEFLAIEAKIREGGGPKGAERQHKHGRLTARERIDRLVDGGGFFQELGLWAAYEMYKEHGGAPGAGVVTGVGPVHGRPHMIIANDATVKAGAFFPMTCKKIIRAQEIAIRGRLPLIYLVDSAGVFLPLQEDVFPDTDDFGRIFRHNAVISAAGIPQIAAIMGNCVAGGGYLPVLCDTLLMTEGSGLYLAGPALVKAAIGQEVTDEELGGAEMHAAISGTIDFREPDDEACLVRVRELVSKYAPTGLTEISRRLDRALHTQFKHFDASSQEMRDLFDAVAKKIESTGLSDATREEFATEAVEEYIRRDLRHVPEIIAREVSIREPKRAMAFLRGIVGEPSASAARAVSPITDAANIYDVFTDKPGEQYDARDLIACFVDGRVLDDGEGNESLQPDFDEYKADYGKSIVCGYARLGGRPVGIVANQKKLVDKTNAGGKAGPSKTTQMPGVIYDDSAEKAARFIMDCNQRRIPLVFLHDTTGFMVGRDSEQGGIIRAGAKMVNAMSNCVVPKIVVILGGSYGAGNYAMCGRAFDQFMALAWPGSKCAVMGAAQATGTLAMIEERARQRRGEEIDEATHTQILGAVRASYTEQQDIRHGAARGWVDRIIQPHETRRELIAALEAADGWDSGPTGNQPFQTGVLQT